MLQATDSIATEAAESTAESLSALKSMSLEDFLSTIINSSIHFLISLAIAIVIFYAGRWIIGKIYNIVNRILIKRKAEASLTTFILSLVNILLYFILIVTVIGILGIPTSTFLALFASAGVAIGMALSGTLQNFAGGVLILLLKPFKVGDFIEAQGFSGKVKAITIFNTILTTPDYKSILIPNGPLSTGSVNNYSTQAYRRVDWTVSISYGNDFPTAQRVLLEMLNEDPRVIKESIDGVTDAPFVRLSSMATSSVDITVRAWVNAADYWNVYFDFNERVYVELEQKAGVSFPFPQLDVHLTSQSN
ncbi:MAG: mechanosensitive ion channel [Lachnoclostridium sp.]|nr:mechanosensitive ion channel [Lachnoclostridium sp.]